jgi:protein phosphatase
MNITLQKPYSMNETGIRTDKEDSVYPSKELFHIHNILFLVCDGTKTGPFWSETACSIACDSIQTFFRTFLDTEKAFEPRFIQKSLQYAGIRFDEHIKQNPTAERATVALCLLYFDLQAVYMTLAGNNRIYQFRNGKMIFKSEDQSFDNYTQGSHSPVDVDIIKITDVLPNDEFFMCTDGVPEVWSDRDLCRVFSINYSPEEKIKTIEKHCRDYAKDNYTAYLIPIREVRKVNVFKQMILNTFY